MFSNIKKYKCYGRIPYSHNIVGVRDFSIIFIVYPQFSFFLLLLIAIKNYFRSKSKVVHPRENNVSPSSTEPANSQFNKN